QASERIDCARGSCISQRVKGRQRVEGIQLVFVHWSFSTPSAGSRRYGIQRRRGDRRERFVELVEIVVQRIVQGQRRNGTLKRFHGRQEVIRRQKVVHGP